MLLQTNFHKLGSFAGKVKILCANCTLKYGVEVVQYEVQQFGKLLIYLQIRKINFHFKFWVLNNLYSLSVAKLDSCSKKGKLVLFHLLWSHPRPHILPYV